MVYIAQWHIDAARQAGACKERRDEYVVGTPLYLVQSEDLKWIDRTLPGITSEVQREIGLEVSLSLLGSSGDGNGYGYGSGSGNGYGFGCGYGNGFGYGDGYGYGYGDGR